MSTLFVYAAYFFVVLGAKLILALITIYLLLPSDRRCSQCDEETLLVRPGRLGRFGAALSLGLVQWRWCPRCAWEGMARRGGEPNPRTHTIANPTAPTRR